MTKELRRRKEKHLMIAAEVLKSPEIQQGSIVVFKNPNDPEFSHHPADREWQEANSKTYPNPLQVRIRIDNHVILVNPNDLIDPKDPSRRDIHFGSTCDPRLHVGHIELFRG